MLKNFGFALLLCTTFAITACSDNNGAPVTGTNVDDTTQGTESMLAAVAVVDTAGNAVPNAIVMIGTAENRPFANNVIKAGAAGTFMPPKEWTTPLPVTIWSEGYVRTTYMAQLPTQKTFAIRAKAAAVKPQLTGTTTGFGELNKDGLVDVGVVIPALTRLDLGSFEVSKLLSPETDTIPTALGQKADLPSNVTLPPQSESIFPVTVKFNKPVYRMFFERRASYKVVSAHVRFPLKKVVNEGANAGVNLVNHFTFLEAGIQETVLTTDKQTVNLAVNKIPFDATIPMSAPAIDSKQSILAVALVQDGAFLYPTDIKNLKSNESRALTFPKASQGFVLSVLHTDGLTGVANETMSLNLSSSAQTKRGPYLPLVAAPRYANGIIVLSPPSSVAGIKSAATLATLSEVEMKPMGQSSYGIKHPQWDVYATGWSSEIALPQLPSQTGALKQRWDAAFIGTASAKKPSEPLGPNLFNSVTHLTRSAVDL